MFSLRRDRKQRLDQATTHDFYVIDCVDWVNVIPLTPDDEIVFIQLHRHGTDETSLEIPGGMIDPRDASPMAAGLRELSRQSDRAMHEVLDRTRPVDLFRIGVTLDDTLRRPVFPPEDDDEEDEASPLNDPPETH